MGLSHVDWPMTHTWKKGCSTSNSKICWQWINWVFLSNALNQQLLWGKSLVAESALSHIQNTWGSRGKKVRTARLAAVVIISPKKNQLLSAFFYFEKILALAKFLFREIFLVGRDASLTWPKPSNEVWEIVRVNCIKCW